MSTMLDNHLDTPVPAEVYQAEIVRLVNELDTAKKELDGLAMAVYKWALESDLGRDAKVYGHRIDQMLVRTGEILGLEGMRQAAAERLAGQGSLL